MNYHTFTGNSRKPRQVNLSGRRNTNPFAPSGATPSSSTVATAQQERERRQRERDQLQATKIVQRYWRGHNSRQQCFRAWRREWDSQDGFSAQALNGNPYSSPEEALEKLRVLLRFVRTRNKEDLLRLRQFLARLSASYQTYPNGFSDTAWAHLLFRLQAVLLKAIESVTHSQDDSGVEELLQGLRMTTERIPDLTARHARSIYKLLRQLAQNAASRSKSSQSICTFIFQTALPPLKAITSDIHKVYEAFACELLTLPELSITPLKEHLLDPLADGVNYKLLCHSLLSTLKSPNHHHYTQLGQQTSRTSLLGIVIYFQRYAQRFQSSYSYASDKDYMSVVTELLSSAATSSAEDEGGATFISEQIESLINNESIASLIPSNNLATTDPNGSVFNEDAKQIASFALTLLRYFPQKSEDIRIKLYMESAGSKEPAQNRVPAIRFFWQSAKASSVVTSIRQNAEIAIPLLRGDRRSSYGLLYQTSNSEKEAIQDEWRVILLFMELYSFALKIMDDEEFFSSSLIQGNSSMNWASQNALPLKDVRDIVYFLKNLGYSLYFHSAKIAVEEVRPRDNGSIGNYFNVSNNYEPQAIEKLPEQLVAHLPGITVDYVKNLVTGVLRMLYERDSRRPFLPKGAWLMMSEFDMDTFIPSVVEEEEKRHRIEEENEDEDGPDDEDEEVALIGASLAARLRQNDRLKKQQRKLARSRHLQAVAPRLAILQNMPFFIPFETRVQIFREFIRLDQLNRRGPDAEIWRMSMMAHPEEFKKHHARIHRTSIFEDAYHQFNELGEGLKEPIQITFVDGFGNEEAGIDGGGVTKEFITSIIQEVFQTDNQLNMFVENEQHLQYPNPAAVDEANEFLSRKGSREAHSMFKGGLTEFLRRYEFLGRVIGKCLYEGILVDVSFAGFFLLKWALTGGYGHGTRESGYRANLNDLRELDEALYQGLIKLKNYPGDVSDFALDFTISDTITTNFATGGTKVITRDLRANGSSTPVTNENRLVYISYVARHRLQVQPFQQTSAFLRGLSTMIQPSWLNMFNQSELQTLVSGTRTSIDIEDLRKNTQYGGVYIIGDDGLEHPTVAMFWDVLKEMTDSERRAVLKFVTSTPRAPLLGFGTLRPQFSIRDSGSEQERLPSTSTCVNLLKLPIYHKRDVLKQKLLTAVFSGAGFDLS